MIQTPPPWPWPVVLAHRCGGSLAPENTLAGLAIAEQYGCGVEFDVMLSADGTPFVIHDETLERTTNGSGLVAHTADDVLDALDAGVSHHPQHAGEPVPRFASMLRHCAQRGLAMNIEIKPAAGHDEATARALAALLTRQPPAITPIVSSFSEPALAHFGALAPNIPRGLLVEAPPPDWLARCQRLGVRALHVDTTRLDPALAAAVRRAGYWLVAYTENDPQHARTLRRWGVDCIITDRPDLIHPTPGAGPATPAPR